MMSRHRDPDEEWCRTFILAINQLTAGHLKVTNWASGRSIGTATPVEVAHEEWAGGNGCACENHAWRTVALHDFSWVVGNYSAIYQRC